MSTYSVAAFYKFIELTNISDLQDGLLKLCQRHNIFGSILLAEEGVNGTIAGNRKSIQSVLSFLRAHQVDLQDLACKYSQSSFIPFKKLKVLIKKEIVTLGVPGIKPHQQSGIYVAPAQWNDLIGSDDVITIDTRNDYEIKLGKFKGAIDPQTSQFRDFPIYVDQQLDPQKHKKIAIYCTGGIRCEKASSYLLQQGFENVYQLEGGILKYLEKMSPEHSLWQGECFIFDNRITVNKDSITSV